MQILTAYISQGSGVRQTLTRSHSCHSHICLHLNRNRKKESSVNEPCISHFDADLATKSCAARYFYGLCMCTRGTDHRWLGEQEQMGARQGVRERGGKGRELEGDGRGGGGMGTQEGDDVDDDNYR